MIKVLPRKPGHQPQHHHDKISRMTHQDAVSEIQAMTTISMQHCVATPTNRTYSSAWNSWVRVAEVFRFPTHCMDSNRSTPLPTVHQLAVWSMHASTSVHTQDVSARDCQNNGQSHDQERISRILQISNRPVCSRWLPKPLGQTTPSIGLHQNTLYHSLGEGGCMTHRHQPYGYCNRRRKSGE